jgi:hypothetical protein
MFLYNLLVALRTRFLPVLQKFELGVLNKHPRAQGQGYRQIDRKNLCVQHDR